MLIVYFSKKKRKVPFGTKKNGRPLGLPFDNDKLQLFDFSVSYS